MTVSAPWNAGLARACITPAEPMPLSGYAMRTENFDSVTSDLHLKTLALEDQAGNRAVVITADLIGFTRSMSNAVWQGVEARTGLPRPSVLIKGSHTHSGPTIFVDRTSLTGEGHEVTRRYVDQVVQTAVDTACKALETMQPARLSWGVGMAPFVMNRRAFGHGGVQLSHNPRGLVDRSVPVLRIDSDSGELRGVLFGAAAHNVTNSPRSLSIDGDYAGFAQHRLEERLPGVQAMFAIGCAGDANTYPRADNAWTPRHGETLGAEVLRVLAGDLQPVSGPLRTALEDVTLPLQTFTRGQIEAMAEDAPQWRSFFAAKALEWLDRGKPLPTAYAAPFGLWQFGQDLTWVTYPGETVVDYVRLAEHVLGPLDLWVMGYCDDVFGYLPSPRVLEEGGYETRGLYTGVGLFAPEAFQVIEAALERLAPRVGRARPGPGEVHAALGPRG